jgi:tetratricopeptide (TPR) repeat protein
MKDFFISYTSADRTWAEWIAWQLEEAKFTVIIQAWDFRPGGNFVLDMQQAAADCERTLAVLSPDYLKSLYAQPEWTAAFAQDPTGAKKLLLPVRVRECELKGLLSQIVYVDLVSATEDEAQDRLLKGINRERAKPATEPRFPGSIKPERTIADKPHFPGALPPVWNVPRPPNPHFVGRDELLEQTQQTLRKGQAAALVALHGLGGVGKTQLAAEYAYARHADYQAVWWLRAETEATLAEDLAALARALALPEHEAREVPVIVTAVLRWLNGNAGWLLVFDNADEPAVVPAYLPQNRQGHVLITSRAPNWRGLATPLAVETLDEGAATQFLLERTGQGGGAAAAKESAKELAKELGCLPLALEQAGAYCEATGLPLANYLRLFRQRQRELLQRGQPANYPATVATTWEISFQAAQQATPAAAELLNLCAFLAPEELPLAVLRKGAEHLPETLAAAVADEVALEDALAALRRYSLLNRVEESVTLHRLVQWVARDRLAATEQARWTEAAVRVINAAFPAKSSDVRSWDECAKLLPHARMAAEFAEIGSLAPEARGRLVNQMGTYFWGRAQYTDAKEAFERALHIIEAAFGPDHPEVAIDVNNLGSVLQDLGDLARARQYLERALRIDEAAFGPDHPEVAIDVNNLGGVLQDLGDLTGARQHFERALHIDEAALGPDHPNVAFDVNNLGSVLRDLGDLAGAQQHFERALPIFEATLGTNHPNVAVLVNNLGGVLQALGDLAGARQHFERALRITEIAFDPDHPKAAIRLNNLGCVLQNLGDLAGARQHFERALHIFTASLGKDHPLTVLARENLATLG